MQRNQIATIWKNLLPSGDFGVRFWEREKVPENREQFRDPVTDYFHTISKAAARAPSVHLREMHYDGPLGRCVILHRLVAKHNAIRPR